MIILIDWPEAGIGGFMKSEKEQKQAKDREKRVGACRDRQTKEGRGGGRGQAERSETEHGKG